MRVTCISTSGADLPASSLDSRVNITRDSEFPLTVGVEYAVYAVTLFRDMCWYYVFDDNALAYPVWQPAPLFRISDQTIPSSWLFGYVNPRTGAGFPVISFPEWASDPFFYERLVDGEARAMEVFAIRRLEAEAVAPDSR